MRLTRTITETNRAELVAALKAAPVGSRIVIEEPVRTTQQNRLLWALLGEISEQLEHCGQKYDEDAWKAAFLKAMGKKLDFMPALDGQGVVAIGYHSSRLSKVEMSEMIEMIYSYGVGHGVTFHGERVA